MPAWLSMDFVAANWQPLLVALILGYIFGWLFTGLPNKRHASEAEDRAASLDARMRKAERELADVRKEGENSKSQARMLQGDLDTAQARIRDLETPPVVEEPQPEEPPVTDADAAFAPAAALDDGDNIDDDADTALAVAAGAVVLEAVMDDGDTMAIEETQTMLIPAVEEADETAEAMGAFAEIARTPDLSGLPTAKDVALTEAYSRVLALQAELDRNDAVLRERDADLESAQAELQAANAARHELESRLIRAREDVASELAVLASTMMKMKDDALARSDARIASMSVELDSLRAQRAAAPRPTATIPAPAIPAPTIPAPARAMPSANQQPPVLPDSVVAMMALANEPGDQAEALTEVISATADDLATADDVSAEIYGSAAENMAGSDDSGENMPVDNAGDSDMNEGN